MVRAGFPGRMGPLRNRNAALQPETKDLFSRMNAQPSSARKIAYNQFIAEVKAAGVWAKLDAIWLMATHDAQAAALNLKSSAFTLVQVNSPTFTPFSGFNGDATTSYLNTQFNPVGAVGAAHTLNSASMGIRSNGDRSGSAAVDIGNFNGTQASFIRAKTAANAIETRVHSNSTNATAMTNAKGVSAVSRGSSTEYTLYKDGFAVATPAIASTSMPNLPYFMLALNSNGSPANFNGSTLSFGFIGGHLTPTEMAALYAAEAKFTSSAGVST